jgi:PhnB protein
MSTHIPDVPARYGTVTPWIIVRGVAPFIDYLTRVFGAVEESRIPNADGSIGHAEVRIGDSVVMMFDAREHWPDTPSFLRLYLADGEAAYTRALAAGGTAVTEMTELFFGDRVGRVRDPWGNLWWIHTRVAELDHDELGRRAQEPRYVKAMRYMQSSLDAELAGRGTRR